MIGEVALHVAALVHHRLLGLAAHLLAAHRGHRRRLRPRLRLRAAGRHRRRRWPSAFPLLIDARRPTPRSSSPASGRLMLLLVAIVAGYARRISGEADRERDARPRPARPTRRRQRPALLAAPGHPDAAGLARHGRRARLDRRAGCGAWSTSTPSSVLLFDDTDGHWEVLRQRGLAAAATRLGHRPSCPPACAARSPRRASSASPTCSAEPAVRASTSAPARASTPCSPARGAIIGLLAIEHADVNHFTTATGELLEGFVEPVALALDNARWFARLRTVGADEERTRIARDLHDRIGQSLAYLAFELDRIVDQATRRRARQRRRSNSCATTCAA